jgi:hypothetical protein
VFDIPSDQGVLHGLNGVLLPPLPSNTTNAQDGGGDSNAMSFTEWTLVVIAAIMFLLLLVLIVVLQQRGQRNKKQVVIVQERQSPGATDTLWTKKQPRHYYPSDGYDDDVAIDVARRSPSPGAKPTHYYPRADGGGAVDVVHGARRSPPPVLNHNPTHYYPAESSLWQLDADQPGKGTRKGKMPKSTSRGKLTTPQHPMTQPGQVYGR